MKCRDKESGLGKAKVDTAGSAYDSGPVEAWLPTEQQSSPAPCLASHCPRWLGPGRGIKIHTFLAFLFVILPNKHRPSFMGTFVIAIHRVARNIYGPALPCTFVINKTPGGQF